MSKLLKQAFTLIELLVVIAIIGILSGLIIVGMSGMTNSATIAKAQVFSNSLRNSLMMNLVSEWKFDGITADGSPATANDILDTWSGGNNGTLGANPPTVRTGSKCVNGSCLQFNGTNNYVDCGANTNLNITSSITVSAWINQTRDAQSSQYIIGNDRDMSPPSGGFDVRTTSNYTLEVEIWKNSSSTMAYFFGSIVPQEVWHYVAFTFNGTNLIIYQNGAQTGNTTITADTIKSAPYNLIIGSLAHSAPTYYRFNGLIDEVRIYNAAIPTSQIKEQYYAGLNGLLTNRQINAEEYSQRINSIAVK